MANHIKRLVRKIRGHDQRLQTLEEDRQPDVEPVLIRRFAETAVSSENVSLTAVEDPAMVWGESDWGRGEWADTADENSNTVVHEESVTNTTTVELDEYRARDLSQSEDDDDNADRIGVGTGDAEPAYENRTLNEPVTDDDGETVTFQLDEYEVDGTTVTVNGFLGTNQANDNTIVEAGVVSSHGRLFNHAIHQPVEKTNAISITYEATLTFDTADSGGEGGD